MKINNNISDHIYELFEEFTQKHRATLDGDFPNEYTIHYRCDCSLNECMQKNVGKEIIVNPKIVQLYNLNKEEVFACIAHEFGHIKDPLLNNHKDLVGREIAADEYACKLGYKQQMILVIKKFIANREILNFTDDEVENLKLRLQKLQQEEQK